MTARRLGSRLLRAASAAIPAALVRAYRRWKRKRGYARFRTREVAHTYAGFPLRLSIEDEVAAAWYDGDWLEPPEIGLLRRHNLRPGSRVFDIGAHQCLLALILARIVGPDGAVIAVEANPHNVDIAKRNRRLNDADQLVIINGAAAATPGTAEITLEPNAEVVDDGDASLPTVSVPAVTVDALTAGYGPPDVLLVDVEGYEAHVLEGSAHTLATHRPDAFVEVHAGGELQAAGASIDDVLARFPPEVYEVWIAPGTDGAKHEFVPWREYQGITAGRFFLVALARERNSRVSGAS